MRWSAGWHTTALQAQHTRQQHNNRQSLSASDRTCSTGQAVSLDQVCFLLVHCAQLDTWQSQTDTLLTVWRWAVDSTPNSLLQLRPSFPGHQHG